MKAVHLIACAAIVAALTISEAASTPSYAANERSYLLATASTGGTYYPVGVALATLIKQKLQPEQKIGMSAINSAGSGENLRLLRENEAQFAILAGRFGYYAWNGLGPVKADGPHKELRSVTTLGQDVAQFTIASKFAKTGTVSDLGGLKGMKMAMGQRNSGAIEANRLILGNLGIDIDKDYELFYLGYGPSADALQNGRVAGMGTPAGVPTGAVTRVLAALGDKATLLSFTPEQVKRADGGLGLWTEYKIAARTYPGLDKEVTTIAQPNFLAVRADVDEDAVYQITKTIYENLPFLNAIHKATKAMNIKRAIAGLPVPLHSGAAKYFEEIGIDIPENLVAK